MNISIKKIGALVLFMFSIFILSGCEFITSQETVTSIEVTVSCDVINSHPDKIKIENINKTKAPIFLILIFISTPYIKLLTLL